MNSLRVGILLGLRQVQRTSIWTNTLIIFVMMFTFLNLVVVAGILVGIIEGSIVQYRDEYIGDVYMEPKDNEVHILNTNSIISTLDNNPSVKDYALRYIGGGTLEAGYHSRRDLNEEANTVNAQISGIVPSTEARLINLDKQILEGEYLEEEDDGYIMLGAYLLKRYASKFGDDFDTLENIHPGDKVRLKVNRGANKERSTKPIPSGQVDNSAGSFGREYIVKGIIKTKIDTLALRVFMTKKEFERVFGRLNYEVDEVSVRLVDDADEWQVKDELLRSGLGRYAKVKTFIEGLPKFLVDMKTTFAILGTLMGAIGAVVAAITIFIIIFINALTKQKYIGILKAIGVDHTAIEIAYVIQSAYYAVVGSILGMIIVYFILVPWFDKHPIDFPFSDGILSAPISNSLFKALALFIITVIAGFVPARLITRRNTLNSILGR